MLFSTCSQTWKLERSKGFFVRPLGHVITLCGHIFVSRTGDETPAHGVCGFEKNASVCTFKTSPCVQAPCAHVETHVRLVPAYTGTFLNAHTGYPRFFSVPQHKQTHIQTHTHTTQHNTQHHTEKERQRKRKRNKRR